MKILLDHNLDWRLSHHLPGHEVNSTVRMGWNTYKNGALLSEAEKNGFALMLSADKNIKTQQRIESRSIALIVLRAHNTKLKTHIVMMSEVVETLAIIQPGELVEVFHPDMKS